MINITAPIGRASSPTNIMISPIGVLGPHGPAPGTKLRINASIPHPPVISPLFWSVTNAVYHGFGKAIHMEANVKKFAAARICNGNCIPDASTSVQAVEQWYDFQPREHYQSENTSRAEMS